METLRSRTSLGRETGENKGLAVKNLAWPGDRREQGASNTLAGTMSRPTEILVLARSPDLARVLTAGLHPSDNLAEHAL